MSGHIKIIEGDITQMTVDAIVNAANESLLGGGGVDGAIHRAAGSGLFMECQRIGYCATGQAVITRGHLLPARHIIHTVGPVYEDGTHGEAELLASCYQRSLELAVKNGVKTIAFPAISCGVYGYPLEEACTIAVREVLNFLARDKSIDEVVFVCFGSSVLNAYHRAMDESTDSQNIAGKITLYDRIVGGILGMVVGDALGVPVEFREREDIRQKPVTDMIGFGSHSQEPGTWSDDSSLALATLDSLLGSYDPRDMMERFRRWRYTQYMTARGAVFDVGFTTQMAIDAFRDGATEPWGGATEQSNGNGSLMRILPLSLCVHRLDPNVVIERSFEVSALTHAHIRSKLCCGYYSLLIKAILEGHNLSGAMTYGSKLLQPYIPVHENGILDGILTGSVLNKEEDWISSSGYVVHTLEASLWCCARHNCYQSAVLAAVNLGGDTDTTGAVAGGLAGVIFGRQAIPMRWIKAVARSGDVQELADALAKKVMSGN